MSRSSPRYHGGVILDFHCHITTPGSRLPRAEGNLYRTLVPPTPAGRMEKPIAGIKFHSQSACDESLGCSRTRYNR